MRGEPYPSGRLISDWQSLPPLPLPACRLFQLPVRRLLHGAGSLGRVPMPRRLPAVLLATQDYHTSSLTQRLQLGADGQLQS